jgi:hypothetical protein
VHALMICLTMAFHSIVGSSCGVYALLWIECQMGKFPMVHSSDLVQGTNNAPSFCRQMLFHELMSYGRSEAAAINVDASVSGGVRVRSRNNANGQASGAANSKVNGKGKGKGSSKKRPASGEAGSKVDEEYICSKRPALSRDNRPSHQRKAARTASMLQHELSSSEGEDNEQ